MNVVKKGMISFQQELFYNVCHVYEIDKSRSRGRNYSK